MGDLKFSDLGRLMAMTAATWSLWAGFWGVCYRKFFWDFVGAKLGPAGLLPTPGMAPFLAIIVTIPVLQILMMVFGVFTLALEWPLGFFKDTSIWRSNIFRVVAYFFFGFIDLLVYQGADGGLYFLITAAVFAKGMSNGETIAETPTTVVRRDAPGGEGRNWQKLGDGGGTDAEKAQRLAV